MIKKVLITLFAAGAFSAAAYGGGARAMGMGGAYTSVSDEPSAIYWNPAGLSRVNRISLTAMGQSLGAVKWETLRDITPSYQFVGLTFPFKQFGFINWIGTDNTFGAGMISNSLTDVTYTTLDASGKIVRDTFDDLEKAYYLSYGFSLLGMESISVGGTFKYISQEFTKIEGAKATGYDFEAGMLYDWNNYTTLGIVMQRGVILNWENGAKDTGTLTTKFGLSRIFLFTDSLSLLGSADLVQRQNQPLFGHFGTELGYDRNVSGSIVGIEGIYLRFGVDGAALENRYDYMTKINNNLNYTAGLGLRMFYMGFAMQLDYVMGSYRLGDKNRFSVSIYF